LHVFENYFIDYPKAGYTILLIGLLGIAVVGYVLYFLVKNRQQNEKLKKKIE